ncbi:MAG: thioredoxin domain-containing protein [Candidatus Peregrinibacteria bacterium]
MKKYLLFLPFFLFLTACRFSDGPSGDVRADSRPFLGDAHSPVVVEEFSDMQCPACAAITPQVERMFRISPSLGHFTYHHFPLSYHENSFTAAEAVECAGDQGKFWEYLDLAFSNQNNLGPENLFSMARSLGLNTDEFGACLDNRDKKDFILADAAEGRRRGLKGTPTLYVNGKEVRFTSAESFENYLRSVAANVE